MFIPGQYLAIGPVSLYDRGQRQESELEQMIRQARLVRPRRRWRLHARKALEAAARLWRLEKLPPTEASTDHESEQQRGSDHPRPLRPVRGEASPLRSESGA